MTHLQPFPASLLTEVQPFLAPLLTEVQPFPAPLLTEGQPFPASLLTEVQTAGGVERSVATSSCTKGRKGVAPDPVTRRRTCRNTTSTAVTWHGHGAVNIIDSKHDIHSCNLARPRRGKHY